MSLRNPLNMNSKLEGVLRDSSKSWHFGCKKSEDYSSNKEYLTADSNQFLGAR